MASYDSTIVMMGIEDDYDSKSIVMIVHHRLSAYLSGLNLVLNDQSYCEPA